MWNPILLEGWVLFEPTTTLHHRGIPVTWSEAKIHFPQQLLFHNEIGAFHTMPSAKPLSPSETYFRRTTRWIMSTLGACAHATLFCFHFCTTIRTMRLKSSAALQRNLITSKKLGFSAAVRILSGFMQRNRCWIAVLPLHRWDKAVWCSPRFALWLWFLSYRLSGD